ncbi:hypothetical protein ACJX0J_030272 [Zea mays]
MVFIYGHNICHCSSCESIQGTSIDVLARLVFGNLNDTQRNLIVKFITRSPLLGITPNVIKIHDVDLTGMRVVGIIYYNAQTYDYVCFISKKIILFHCDGHVWFLCSRRRVSELFRDDKGADKIVNT